MQIKVSQVLREEWRFIFTNKRLLLVLFAAPVVLTLIFGASYSSGTLTELAVAVFDEDDSQLSRQLIQAIDASPTLRVAEQVSSAAEVERAIDEKRVWAGIVIPADLKEKLSKGEAMPVLAMIDGSNMVVTNIITKGLNQVVATMSAGVSMQGLMKQGMKDDQIYQIISAIPFEYRILYNPALNYSDFLVYALVVIVVQQMLLLGIGLTVSREREQGTWERFAVWKTSPWKIAFAKTVPYFFIGILDVLVVSCLTTYVFQMINRGTIWEVLALSACFSFSLCGLGYLISLAFKEQVGALQICMLLAVVSFVLSGYTWPVEALPNAFQWIGKFMPLTYFLDGLKEVYLKGNSFEAIDTGLVNMFLIGMASYLLAFLATRFLSFSHRFKVLRSKTADSDILPVQHAGYKEQGI